MVKCAPSPFDSYFRSVSIGDSSNGNGRAEMARGVIAPRWLMRMVVGFQVTQIPMTCAQIATILKNSASEASVANSSTMVRPMSLPPTSVQKSNVFPCFGLTLEGSRFIGRAGNGNVHLRAEH